MTRRPPGLHARCRLVTVAAPAAGNVPKLQMGSHRVVFAGGAARRTAHWNRFRNSRVRRPVSNRTRKAMPEAEIALALAQFFQNDDSGRAWNLAKTTAQGVQENQGADLGPR